MGLTFDTVDRLEVPQQPVRPLGAEELADRGLHAERIAGLIIGQADQVEGERFAGEHLFERQSQPISHPSAVLQGSFQDVASRVVYRLLHACGRRDAEPGAPHVQRLQRVLLAPTFDPDHALPGYAHVGQRDLVRGRAALPGLLLVLTHQEPFGVGVDHKAGGAHRGPRIEAHHAGDVAVGDPHLRAVHDVELVDLFVADLSDQRDVVDVHPAVAVHVVPVLLNVVRIRIFVGENLGGLRLVVVPVEDLQTVELEAMHVADVSAVVLRLLIQVEVADTVLVRVDASGGEVCFRPDPRGIRPGARLGEGEGRDHARRDEPQEEFVGLASAWQFTELTASPFAPALQRLERLLEATTEALEIPLHPGQPCILQLVHEASEHDLLEDAAAADLCAGVLAQRHECLLEVAEVRGLEHRHEVLQRALDRLDRLRLIHQLPQIALGGRYVLVKSQQDRRRAYARVRLDGERVAHVRQTQGDLAEIVVIRFPPSLAAQFLRDHHPEEALLQRPVDMTARDVVQLFDVAIERRIVVRLDEPAAEEVQVLFVV